MNPAELDQAGAMAAEIKWLRERVTQRDAENVVRSERWEARLAIERTSKDTAYSERDRLVCAISKLFPSHLERHPESDLAWEDDWRWIVFVQFPTGQASWHIHDSELGWFDHLQSRDGNSWDGHSTAEKYARIERFDAIGDMTSDLRERVTALEQIADGYRMRHHGCEVYPSLGRVYRDMRCPDCKAYDELRGRK